MEIINLRADLHLFLEKVGSLGLFLFLVLFGMEIINLRADLHLFLEKVGSLSEGRLTKLWQLGELVLCDFGRRCLLGATRSWSRFTFCGWGISCCSWLFLLVAHSAFDSLDEFHGARFG